jgi:hypothetical protein
MFVVTLPAGLSDIKTFSIFKNNFQCPCHSWQTFTNMENLVNSKFRGSKEKFFEL